MSAQQLWLLTVSLYGIGAVAALAGISGRAALARTVSSIAGLLAGLTGLVAAALVLVTGSGFAFSALGPIPFAALVVRVDALSAFMIGVISLLVAATSLYSFSYLDHYDDRAAGVLGLFTHVFVASMFLVVSVDNAFYFLIFWELMTLASYLLVIFDQEEEGIKAGYLYFLMAHAGTLLILFTFLLYYFYAGSFDWNAFRSASLPPFAQNLAFLMAFVGFGVKAGIVPLHVWLPRAHPAAPSHISALMSGVMIKIAIYGIVRVAVDFLGSPEWWWGAVVAGAGGISAVIGVLYALAERDLKKMLAYSSVENVGIILMGIGVGMIGIAVHQPVVAALGFLAGLYHLLNHAVFKSLLFLGAGSVVYRLHTRDMDKMGGLAKAMPWTAALFLVGALAVAAIPPLNGFVSEWFTYQSLFLASRIDVAAVRTIAPLIMVLLAVTGALAAMTFVKAYGIAFSGTPKSPAAEQAREAPAPMIAAMAVLALGAVVLGVGAPLVAPFAANVAAQWLAAPALTVASGMVVFPADAAQATFSAPLVAILLIALASLPFILIAVYGGAGMRRRLDPTPWACGYGYSDRMSLTATAFGQPLRVFLRPLYAARTLFNAPGASAAAYGKRATAFAFRAESLWETYVTQPIAAGAASLGEKIQVLQMGDIRVYCLYIVITLAILLIASVR